MWVHRTIALTFFALFAIACGGKSIKTIGGGEAGAGSECEDTLCDGDCVDTSNDPRNCGECFRQCDSDQACVSGTCRPSLVCDPPTTFCNGECVDLRSSNEHCGGCGFACGFGATCQNGGCVPQCPGGQCGNLCVDFNSDPANCGGCGYACGRSQFCSDGRCFDFCQGEFVGVCNGVCVDLSSDPANCGGCGFVCGGGSACVGGGCFCPGGTSQCFDRCVDTNSDVANCGGCGFVCPSDAQCAGGRCVPVCPMGTLCGMECVDIFSDPNHCGGCFSACNTTSRCIMGTCIGSGTGCGNRVLEPGEEADPPPGPVSVVPLDPGTCRYDFSRINQWYCNGSCGNWGGLTDCDQGDADAFCRLKMDNPRSVALNFSIIDALPQPGVCCPPPSFPPGSLGCTTLGTLTSRGVSLTISVHPTNLFSTHQGGNVITNLVCTDP
jgi:hypothetical protein